MIAPPPLNLAAMADAWNDPIAFGAQLASYYRQLEEAGYRVPADDITTATRFDDAPIRKPNTTTTVRVNPPLRDGSTPAPTTPTTEGDAHGMD